jgi:general secretion pathway protein L
MAIKILGVDFRENAVSVALIRGSYKGVWLEAHAQIFLERTDDVEKGLESCLETVSEQADISNAICIAALPSNRFFYRNILSPFRDPQKIDQMLPYELEQSLPVPADDLVIDFIPVDFQKPDEKLLKRIGRMMGVTSREASTRILTVAIEKTQIAAYLSCLKKFDIEPERIVPGGYALAYCLMQSPKSPVNWLLVDVDKTHTALYLILSRTLAVIRAFPCVGTFSSAGSISADIFPSIQQTLLASCKDTGIDRIFLAGGLSDALAVASALSEMCDLPVQPVNLVMDAGIRFQSELLVDWRPETGNAALAAALARMNGMAGLNLRKGLFAMRTSWAACRTGFLRTAFMSGLAVLAAFAYVRIDTQVLQNRLDGITHRIDQVLTGTFPEIATIVDPLHQMREHVQQAQRRMPGSDNPGQVRLVDILAGISSRIPENVPLELVRFIYENNGIQLTGHTDSFNFVEEIKRRLEGTNGGFSQVTIVSANLDNTGNRVQFHLDIKI